MVLARTVANGCDRERNVERTHPQPPDPQSETGTLATHSGKNEETLPRGEPQQSGIGQYGDNMGGLSEKNCSKEAHNAKTRARCQTKRLSYPQV